jgi:hypothetical protein
VRGQRRRALSPVPSGRGASERLADLQLHQLALARFAAVGNRAEQRGIDATEAGEHACVLFVALGLALRDRAEFAGIGHPHAVAKFFQQPAHPRRVRAGLQDEGRRGVALGEGPEALAGVGDFFLGENLAAGGEDARAVPAVPEVQAYRDIIGRVHKT